MNAPSSEEQKIDARLTIACCSFTRVFVAIQVFDGETYLDAIHRRDLENAAKLRAMGGALLLCLRCKSRLSNVCQRERAECDRRVESDARRKVGTP